MERNTFKVPIGFHPTKLIALIADECCSTQTSASDLAEL